jgi:uncharacterized protein YmfQ (DUF2313 family)
LDELFPDTTVDLIASFERVFNLSASGTIPERQQRILAAYRALGGLSIAYLEDLGDVLGNGVYTVVLTEGSDNVPFTIHEYSPLTHPAGPATLLPGPVYDPPFDNTCYTITVTVTGSAGPENELEKLYSRLKPTWTEFVYVYIP